MNKQGRPQTISKDKLLDEAIRVAKMRGYQKVTREELAQRFGCSTGSVSKQFGTMVQLRRAIMSAAIARNELDIIAQGLAAGDSKAMAAKPEIKRAALERFL